MKRLRLIILIATMAVALAVPVVAKATGSTGSSVTIEEFADYDAAGLILDVGLYVRCYGGVNGEVLVTVEQSPPETPYPIGFASGPQSVVCDGKTHRVGVTIVALAPGFDAGRALATATLFVPTKPDVTAKRWITIVVV